LNRKLDALNGKSNYPKAIGYAASKNIACVLLSVATDYRAHKVLKTEQTNGLA